jgi:hypothetical protein
VRLLLLLACNSPAPDESTVAADSAMPVVQDTASEETGAVEEEVVNGTCVPEGERFLDTHSCATVIGPVGDPELESTAKITDPDPERLKDADHDWVRAQMAACSCICCHDPPGEGEGAPSGEARSIWDASFEPVWTDSATNSALEGVTGLKDISHDGIPPEENYGFERFNGSIPTTDSERLQAYGQRELERRAK